MGRISKLADRSGQSTADGAAVNQYTANGGANQRWRLAQVA
ncbi:RICIN domain-containing protein [Acrocarpospora corrugata]|nr:RICIN domain-containing protein [Acrocarpospora corrugata]